MFIATIIAGDGISRTDLADAAAVIGATGASVEPPRWIDEGVAADIPFKGDTVRVRSAIERFAANSKWDVIVQQAEGRAKRLLLADMDSTMITIECIDELADYAGIKAQVAEVTERAMRGELDFEGALDARVSLLAGLEASVIQKCYEERVRIMAGAKALIGTMRKNGARCILVSGGFTVFADRVAAEIGFDRALSNTLMIADGLLSGTVARPIIGAAAKRETLLAEASALGLELSQTLAVGDGANDIPMIEAAGLGVAYHAKPKTAAAADARVDFGDLSILLYAQGYSKNQWIDG